MTERARSAFAIAVVVLMAVATLGIAWVTRANEGKRALIDCDAALERGDLAEAVAFARVAAEARCPTCSAPEQGLSKLEKIAQDAEARGDDATAFAAWRATRAALLATAIMSTSSTRRSHADSEVARFAHRIDAAAVAAGATATPAAAEDRLRAALAENDVPGGAAYAVIGAGGVLLLLGGLRFVRAAKRSLPDALVAIVGIALAVAGVILF